MDNARLIRACRREKVDRIPVWFMRQTGRYMPEYREIRRGRSFTEICRDPELVAELTVLPVEKFNVDAAIIFSDILTPLEACGFKVAIDDLGGGVRIEQAYSERDMEKLKNYSPESTHFVYEGIKLARKLLGGKAPIIGFAGAPFTLACYIVEGRISRGLARVKKMMYCDVEKWNELMDSLAFVVFNHVKEQVRAGAEVIQLFDSWAGHLSPADYEYYVMPLMRRLIPEIKKLGCYIIYFSTCSSGILRLMSLAGGDVIGVDWRVDIAEAWSLIGYDKGIQGNLDPAVLLSCRETIERAARKILEKVGRKPGFIFNLGHGILPETPPHNVKLLVDYVHSYEVDGA